MRLLFFMFFLPVLDVLGRDFATAFAFAGILEFAVVIAGLATAQALAVIFPGAALKLGHFLRRRRLAQRGFSRGGVGGRGRFGAVGTAVLESGAVEQTGNRGRNQDFSGVGLHKGFLRYNKRLCLSRRRVTSAKDAIKTAGQGGAELLLRPNVCLS